jgi:ABC-2 type transport system permease protein
MTAALPYLSAFRMRFVLMLQYRAAAIAGFATQCWWGFIKVMVFAAFFASTTAHQPIDFGQAVTYTWLGQAFLALLPWAGDPDIAEMVRTGNVSYERLRPLDTYFYWYARAMAWMAARAVPRSAMMFVLAAVLVPIMGLGDWRLRMPASPACALLFVIAMACVLMLASALVMLINILTVVTLSDRGANAIAVPLVLILSGSIVPLPFFPNWMQPFLFLQPFAGLVDIPYRIYFGNLSGWTALAAVALALVWAGVIALIGHRWMSATMGRLQVQGG